MKTLRASPFELVVNPDDAEPSRAWVLEHLRDPELAAACIMHGQGSDRVDKEFVDACGPNVKCISTFSVGFGESPAAYPSSSVFPPSAVFPAMPVFPPWAAFLVPSSSLTSSHRLRLLLFPLPSPCLLLPAPVPRRSPSCTAGGVHTL